MTDTTPHDEVLRRTHDEASRLIEERLELLAEEAPDEHEGNGKCRGCGEPYNGYGDGWNGYCPDCADKIEAARQTEDVTPSPEPTWCVQRLGLGLRFVELTSGTFTTQATFNEGPDGIVMTSLTIGGFKPDHPLTFDLLHELATEARDAVRADAFTDWMHDNGITHDIGYATRGRNGRITDEHLTIVAAVFEGLTRAGMKTRPFMADWWGVTEATVSRWITHARRRGLLGPADPRHQGGRRPQP